MVAQRTRVVYEFSVDQAIEDIAEFNRLENVAADHLVATHFAGVEASLDPATVAERIVLIDSLWRTQLFWRTGAADRIIGQVAQRCSSWVNDLQTLRSDALDQNPHGLAALAETILPTFWLIADDSETPQYRCYSLATKFLHWVTREHFPIVDDRSRKAINRLQTAAGVCRGKIATTLGENAQCECEYSDWIDFYSDLLHALSAADRSGLREADARSQRHDQAKGLVVENSLLRILDKVFYVQGSRLRKPGQITS